MRLARHTDESKNPFVFFREAQSKATKKPEVEAQRHISKEICTLKTNGEVEAFKIKLKIEGNCFNFSNNHGVSISDSTKFAQDWVIQILSLENSRSLKVKIY